MGEWVGWTLAGVSTMLIGVVSWAGRILTRMPLEYVPRDQVNARFESIRAEMKEDTHKLEQRSDKRFDSVDGKLDRILDRLDRKADKQ